MSVLEGDALGTCASDIRVLDEGEGWLCLLFFPRLGNPGHNSVAARLMCHGLAHCRSVAWDPGPGAGQCMRICGDCICVITLFRVVKLLFLDWAVCSTQIGPGMRYYWANTSEVGGLRTIYPSCDVFWLSHRDEWRIKGLRVVIMAGGDDVTRVLLCASERATSVGVVPSGMTQIVMIGLLDCGATFWATLISCTGLPGRCGWRMGQSACELGSCI